LYSISLSNENPSKKKVLFDALACCLANVERSSQDNRSHDSVTAPASWTSAIAVFCRFEPKHPRGARVLATPDQYRVIFNGDHHAPPARLAPQSKTPRAASARAHRSASDDLSRDRIRESRPLPPPPQKCSEHSIMLCYPLAAAGPTTRPRPSRCGTWAPAGATTACSSGWPACPRPRS
jgi:hypothetical protein